MRKTLAFLLTILMCLTGAFSLAEEAGEVEQGTFTCEEYEYEGMTMTELANVVSAFKESEAMGFSGMKRGEAYYR